MSLPVKMICPQRIFSGMGLCYTLSMNSLPMRCPRLSDCLCMLPVLRFPSPRRVCFSYPIASLKTFPYLSWEVSLQATRVQILLQSPINLFIFSPYFPPTPYCHTVGDVSSASPEPPVGICFFKPGQVRDKHLQFHLASHGTLWSVKTVWNPNSRHWLKI